VLFHSAYGTPAGTFGETILTHNISTPAGLHLKEPGKRTHLGVGWQSCR
jgi:hypothetical protein